jgi:hypothetical protein
MLNSQVIYEVLSSVTYILSVVKLRKNSTNNQYNAQICTTALFIYAGSYMFRQQSAIFRELLDPSELRENTDRYCGLSYNVVKWPVCRSVVVQPVVLPS